MVFHAKQLELSNQKHEALDLYKQATAAIPEHLAKKIEKKIKKLEEELFKELDQVHDSIGYLDSSSTCVSDIETHQSNRNSTPLKTFHNYEQSSPTVTHAAQTDYLPKKRDSSSDNMWTESELIKMLNEANLNQLKKFKVIGKKRAALIIQFRNGKTYERLEDLLQVPGFTPKIVSSFKDKNIKN